LRDSRSKAPKTTLIVTPSSLLPQWVSEIEKHAPSLRVFVFDGWTQIRKQVALTPLDRKAIEAKKQKKTKGRAKKKPLKKKLKQIDDEEDEEEFTEKPTKGKGKGKGTRPVVEEEQSEDEGHVPQPDDPIDDWARFCNEFDIVITSYTTLGKELGVARGSSERPRRWGVKYGDENKPRSPLVGVEWARVIMDEVQMAGGHQTVQMVSLLPREYSFAVSGTPARGEVDDLRHVLESVSSWTSAL
jgi:E3 ubiquitin-protein ligase SHPRH